MTLHPLPAERRGEYWWLETSVREVRLSNVDKVFFPHTGYTKGDVLSYYWNARDRVLPYVAGRPLTMIWYPQGIGGRRMLMKDPPKHAPEWLPVCHLPHFQGGTGSNRFPMITDESHLMYLANMACIDFHPLHARCDEPSVPDYLLVDIDPAEGASFADVRVVALHVKAAFEALGLEPWVKSTGGTGIHVYVPIERNVTFDATRAFVDRIARAIRDADRERVTLDWAVDKRSGKVFIDANMNRRGQNTVATWCVRPVESAMVAVPVTWDEVADGFEPSDFDITNALERADIPMPDPVDVREAMTQLGVTV